MKLLSIITAVFIEAILLTGSSAPAAAPTSASQKAKQDAEAKGYIFLNSHEEILSRAKKEGRIRVLSSQDPDAINPDSAVGYENFRSQKK
jgi:hypothetical protein